MNILFLTLSLIREKMQKDIYSSLMREFAKNGHDVYIVSPVERKEKRIISRIDNGKLHYLYAPTGNYYNTGWIEKGITTVFLSKQYKNEINREIGNINIDLILYSTPPITIASAIRYTKKKYKAKTYLMLKDIWPQTMEDLGTPKRKGLWKIIYSYYEKKEKKLYLLSDYIGCMSPACVDYMIKKYTYIKKNQVEICPNALNFDDSFEEVALSLREKNNIRDKYFIPKDRVVFVFGGNIGNGHDPDFLEKIIKLNENRNNTYILFVGRGVFFERIREYIESNKVKNSQIINNLPQDEYLELMAVCDVGMITLDKRFTCPNYPSRLLSYMVSRKPIIVAQDAVSDVGEIAEKNGYGYWCGSDEPQGFVSLMDHYLETEKRVQMGEAGYSYLKKHYNTKVVYQIIMDHLNK